MSRTLFTLGHEDNIAPHAETSQKVLTCRWHDARGCLGSSLHSGVPARVLGVPDARPPPSLP